MERNNRNFEDLESSMEDTIASLMHTLYLWTVAYLALLSITYALNEYLSINHTKLGLKS